MSPENSDAQQPKSEWREYGTFLLKLALIVVIFRSLILSPFNIPSESMQPRLLIGDYLLVAKWPYGYSKYSLPFAPDLFSGRIFGSLPERGDVVVFRGPEERDNVDFIKRAIGLPGDVISMKEGVLQINGTPVKREKMSDWLVPVTENMRDATALEGGSSPCWRAEFEEKLAGGDVRCRYRRFKETLPNGRSYESLDIADGQQVDDIEPIVVPEGQLLMMGDNRDRSADSRQPDNGVWIGLIPIENVVGRAQVMMFSTDGTARWLLPWTWLSATRWDRIGGGF